MKVVFLDFDGVLNSQKWVETHKDKFKKNLLSMDRSLDHAAVARVDRLCKLTGAKVVVSSSWRLFSDLPQLRTILKKHGFTGEVIDETPHYGKGGAERGFEIQDWLNSHGPVESFVILDDGGDMVHLCHKLVQTDWEDGLQDEHVEDALEVLNGE